MSKEKVSYWTKRRRLREAVEEHIQAVESSAGPLSVDTTCIDETSHQVKGNAALSSEQEPNTSHSILNTTNSERETLGVSDIGHGERSDRNEFPFADYYHSESSEEDDLDLGQKLAGWAVDYRIPHVAFNSLLTTLRQYHSNLPKDSRTLLHTVRSVSTQNLAGGSYYHIGLKNGVISILDNIPNSSYLQDLSVKINIDGLPLFKSSNIQLWPILGIIDQLPGKEPFIIGLFSGTKKPNCPNEFLEAFIAELKILEKDGLLYGNKVFSFHISAVICDTQARCFIKRVKGHGGYSGCDKCSQHGKWIGKMTFPETNASLRTDRSFKERKDEQYYLGLSPFKGYFSWHGIPVPP